MRTSPSCPQALGCPPQVPVWGWQAPFRGHIPRRLVGGCGGAQGWQTPLQLEGPLAVRPGMPGSGMTSYSASPRWALLCDTLKVSAPL